MDLKITLFLLLAVTLATGMIMGRSTIGNLLAGRVLFPDEFIGKVLTMEDGQKFKVFRCLRVNGGNNGKEKPAVFVVRFRFKNLSLWANRRLSIIPAPFLAGMEGFRGKDWTISEENMAFQGIYQWSSRDAAEKYPQSFIFKMMTKRAVPGTVEYEILSGTDMSAYIEKLSRGK